MSLDKINELVSSIAKMVESNEKVAIPIISIKLSKMAEAHPYDQTIVSMANIFNKMADHNKLFVTRSELKSLYNKLYTRNTKFAEYFQAELGVAPEVEAPKPVESKPIVNAHQHFSDPILSNALNSAFDKHTPLKTYSDYDANSAKVAVTSNLEDWNLRASKLEIGAGNEHFIIVNASYNTPKGTTSILVPVETVKGKTIQPSMFMCNAGPQELNHVNIKNYLTTFAGAKLKVRAEAVLAVITKEVLGGDVISNVEMAATKVASTKERTGDFGGVLGQKVMDLPRNLEVFIPKSAESDSFAAKFSTAAGVAGFTFGTEKLNLGREVLARALAGFGIKNPQINVVGHDNSTVFYGVALFGGKTAFKVPVKIAGNRVTAPEVIICNGALSSFSKESISQLLVAGVSDNKVAAVVSPQHTLNAADLVNNVQKAVGEENYAKAEDALNILQQSGNEVAYKEAFACYINGLGGMTKSASSQKSCNMIVKTATSSHPICGHTNLPLHKVYQDEHGNCQPNYRKGMDGNYQGAFFMNSKIFG